MTLILKGSESWSDLSSSQLEVLLKHIRIISQRPCKGRGSDLVD